MRGEQPQSAGTGSNTGPTPDTVAYAPRNRLAIRRRAVAWFLLRAVSKIIRTLRGRRLGDRFSAVALVVGRGGGKREPDRESDRLVLGSALNRLAWYLGGVGVRESVDGSCRIHCLVPPDLAGLDPEVPVTQRDYLDRLPTDVIRPAARISGREYDWLLLDAARDLRRWRWLRRIDRVRITDPAFFSGVEHAGWQMVMERTVDRAGREALEASSQANLERLVDRHGGAGEVVVLGTGPSVEGVADLELTGRPVVICNSLVKNDRLLEHLRPVVVCFADEVFHLGPSAYAAAFRDDLLRVVERYEPFIVTRPDGAALLQRHHPELADHLIGLPMAGRIWNVPGSDAFRVRPTVNIMTLYMLPVAARLGRTILIGGSDGRRPGETYFWKHGRSVQYEGLMATAFATHPAFFRDRIYTDYYDTHVRQLEALLTALEARGHRLVSLTPSWIPALRRRQPE